MGVSRGGEIGCSINRGKGQSDGPDSLGSRRAAHRTVLRAVVIIDLLLAGWYFQWLLNVHRASNPLLYVTLVLAEMFNLALATCFWWTAWQDRPHRRASPWMEDVSVDVLIPVRGEPVDVVAPTLHAATRLLGADVKVCLLDDGDSDDMAALAERAGVRYIRRSAHEGAKAGNINHALALTSSPYVAVFDCDHVPLPHFLESTIGHFVDLRLAFVQTPQYYSNGASSPVAAAAAVQQQFFYGVVCRGKASMSAMPCCGTNVVFRRKAWRTSAASRSIP